MTSFVHKRARVGVAVAAAVVLAGSALVAAQAKNWPSAPTHDFNVNDDSFSTKARSATGDVLKNDKSATAVVRHTDPSNGKLALEADGTFTYTPNNGFTGTDTFTYTATDAVSLFQDTTAKGDPLPPIGTFAGPNGTTTSFSGEGYGSSFAPVPGPGKSSDDLFYGLTDRGPNADDPLGKKSEPLTSFTPQIGEFKLVDGKAELQKTILLKGPKDVKGPQGVYGQPYSGRPPAPDTAEVIDDVKLSHGATGVPVASDPDGYDSEGLVALDDGTFWVSDEYGPYITHFDANGYEIGRITPYRNSPNNQYHKVVGYLPDVYADRLTNKGMEGLTVTPDGSTLVGVMQSALQMPDLGSIKAANVAVTRIITIDLRSLKTHEYLYLLDDPATTKDANSEITALSDTKFLVDERDGNFEPFANKVLYEVDINGATDISGLTIDGKSPEAFVGAATTNAALAALTAKGVHVAQKQPYLQIGTLLSQLDPTGGFFAHDKVEGVATIDAGQTLYLSNDDDFGIDYIGNCGASAPCAEANGSWAVHQKVLTATGQEDNGEILEVDTTKLPAVLKTATVTINVR